MPQTIRTELLGSSWTVQDEAHGAEAVVRLTQAMRVARIPITPGPRETAPTHFVSPLGPGDFGARGATSGADTSGRASVC